MRQQLTTAAGEARCRATTALQADAHFEMISQATHSPRLSVSIFEPYGVQYSYCPY